MHDVKRRRFDSTLGKFFYQFGRVCLICLNQNVSPQIGWSLQSIGYHGCRKELDWIMFMCIHILDPITILYENFYTPSDI